MKILFVCRHNRYRSKLAEAFFNKYNKKKSNKAVSRGVLRDIDVAKTVLKVAKEFGVRLSNNKSYCMSRKDIVNANLIIIVANNVPKSLFLGKKVLVWKFKDTSQENVDGIRKTAKEIEKKVKSFIKKI